jgi:hypothetical protein
LFKKRPVPEGPAICLSGQFPAIDAEEVLRGRVTLAGLPPVDLFAGQGARVDWLSDPYGNRSWALNLHALRWMAGLVTAYERSGERAYLDRASALAKDWVRRNPRGGAEISSWAWAEHPVALRAPALVCLSAHVPGRWLLDSLAAHGELLADRRLYREGHNHGLDQDIALLLVGCRLGRARWRDLAIARMATSAELAIDAQGVLHEQAPRYGVYVHRRLGVAIQAIERTGAAVPEGLAARREALEAYIAHATQPDGRLVPIGDTPADARPGRFRHDGRTVRVFASGYVFGRTAWDDPGSAYYSIRFGPGRRLHGHEDHLGVTYHARGGDILVEAGFHSYERTEYPKWTRSPEAHNVPVVEGAPFRAGTATRLVRTDAGERWESYVLDDDAYGVRRTRAVLVRHGNDLMAVLDSVPEGHAARSLWHFAPGLSVLSRGGGRVVLGNGDRRVTLVHLAIPGCRPADGQEVSPGTIATGYLRTAETVTVRSPTATSLLTLIVPGVATVARAGCGVTVATAGGQVTVGIRGTALVSG